MINCSFYTEAEASEHSAIPELPNFITVIYRLFYDKPWAGSLRQWESLIFSLIIAAAISFIFYLGTRKHELIPKGFQNFLELIVDILRNMILEILGPQGEKFVPLLGTLFIYILSMNLIGLVPFMKS